MNDLTLSAAIFYTVCLIAGFCIAGAIGHVIERWYERRGR